MHKTQDIVNLIILIEIKVYFQELKHHYIDRENFKKLKFQKIAKISEKSNGVECYTLLLMLI